MAAPNLDPTIYICGHTLAMVEEGALEPISLLKNRILAPNSLNTPSSSSPSGPTLDSGMRTASTPGGTINQANPPSSSSEMDVSMSFGSNTDGKNYGSTTTKNIYEYFVAASLASLSQNFCSKAGAVPLDARSCVLPVHEASTEPGNQQAVIFPTVVSLRVHLTTTGSLLIGISSGCAPGMRVTEDGLSSPFPPSGSTVLAAPLGLFGTAQGLADGDQLSVDGSTAPSPDTQISRFRPDTDRRSAQWRSSCCKLLEMRGVSSAVLKESSWISIQFIRRRPNEPRPDGKRTPVINPHTHIMWPAALCYRKRTRSPLILNQIIDLDINGFKDSFDALNSAKTWFTSHDKREEFLIKNKKERESTAQKEVSEADHRLLQSGLSPHTARRTSNSGVATGTMYPTPPDGVQNPTVVTSSIDGTISSPGNTMPSAAIVDIDTTMTVPGNIGDSFGDGWHDNEPNKREQSFSQENWDLNEDVFVDNDITDADFNFFDEQPSALDVGVPDLPGGAPGPPNPEPVNPMAMYESHRPPDHHHHSVKAENSPAPPVFAKPELKHARSTMGEGRHRENVKPRPSNGVKRAASPFDPSTVYKKLRASLAPTVTVRQLAVRTSSRRGSAFDKLDFDQAFSHVNKKYEQNGRFDFREEHQDDSPHKPDSPVTTDYLKRHGKARGLLKELPSNLGAQIVKITDALEVANVPSGPTRGDEAISDADDISLISDQDDASDFSDEPSSPTKMSVRRRGLADDTVDSPAASLRGVDLVDEPSISSSIDISKLSLNDVTEVPILRYFADPEPISLRTTLNDDEFMMAAQVLTEQAVSGSLQYALLESTAALLDTSTSRRDLTHSIRSSLQILQTTLPPSLQAATGCQLRQLVEVQDVPLLATPNRIQPRPPGGGPEQRNSLVQIPPPHLELRRNDTKLSVLSSAVNFWEILGLGPSQGPKDVHSVCVFPNLDGMNDNAGVFLDRLRSVYLSLKLGSFERMPSSPTIANGLLPFEVDKTNNNPIIPQASRSGYLLVDEMAKLAVSIFNTSAVSKNFVIFFVYTPENPSTLVEACLAFNRMFELYRRALTDRKKTAQNELVLQLVPLNYIATSASVVALPPGDCIRLCLEIYDRCKLFGGPMPCPAIVLEQQPVTQGINFQLRNQPSANVLQENSCMHIAYAQSVDERWITAAWTDNRGCKQMTASYCLGRKGRPLSRSFTDVAHEIWTTTHDLTSIWKVHWRIIITKVGPMDQQEINDWMTLASTEIKSSVTLTLLTVETNPSLQLVPAIPKVSMTAQSAFYSTPVSTPQPSMTSPEQFGNPPTPKGGPTSASTPGADNNAPEIDGDASLVDVTDTTWGAIASHRLNTSYSLTDPSPALISGYLIKRNNSSADDPPAVLEVNVVHCEGNPRMHEMLLREMLSVFRGLGTVARARSVTEREGDVRPWHVAAVEKSVQALYQLM